MAGLRFLEGGGEMGERIRAANWRDTELGPPELWPQSLRTALRLILNTGHPAYIFWGPRHLCFYNDAYRRSIGPERHPGSLGQPGRDVWDEIWPIIGPQIEQVMAGRGATWNVNHLVPITRHGRREDVYWTYSYSPIDDVDSANQVGGVLVICTETTPQVQAALRIELERDKLAQLFDQAPIFMAVLRGPEHRFEFINPRYAELVDRREVIGKTVAEALPETREQGYLELLDSVYRSGEAYSALGARWTPRPPPGQAAAERAVDFAYQPIKESDGRVTGILVTGAEVTARIVAESERKQLLASEQAARAAAEVAAARLAVLQSLTAKLAAARSAAAVAHVIMTDGLERLGADVGVVALLSADGRTLTNVGFEGVSSELRAQWESYPVDSPVPVAEAARTGRMVVVASREERNRRYPVLAAAHGPHVGGPVIALPLRIAERTGGVLAFCFPDAPAFHRHGIEFFQALADQCALALERAALEDDLRREQQALRDREARLNFVHDNAGIGAWEWDAATNQVFWSDQYREVYGLDPDEPPSFERGIGTVVEEDREPALAELREALETGEQFRNEHRIHHSRKGLRWIAASGKVIRDADGNVHRMVGIVLDVTDMKAAEMAVRESAARFRGLLEQAPFSVQVLAPDGRTLQVNAAWSKLWSASFEQLAGYNMLEDRQLEERGILSYIRRAFAGEVVEIPEIRYDPAQTLPGILPGEDHARWVTAIAYPRKDEAGQLREVVLIHRDVTAERQAGAALRDSEEKFRLLAETIPQMAWMVRPDGDVFWYNRRWYEYTGIAPGDLAGAHGLSRIEPEMRAEVGAAWERSLATGVPFEMVIRLRGADGNYRPFLTRMNPLRNADGTILSWFGTNTDISEMKRLEESLREADRRKDEFLATLAHELRNPLAPIRNALQILQLPRAEPSLQQQAREVMERQVHHMTRLVDDLLDVSRVMRGRIDLRRQPVTLGAIVARAVETAQPLIDAQGHDLQALIGDEPLHVNVDPERMVQVLANLLTNSAKYTPRGGRIVVSAHARGPSVELRVRDNGIGIPPEVLPRVFELFVQGAHGSVRAASGLGVGLTLVKNLVELHDGQVEIRSEGADRGTEAIVRLPRIAAPQAAVATAASPARPSVPAVRALVVDDNRDAADTLGTLLRLQGHDVTIAYDGPGALEAARTQAPTLVLLDIGMPGMDGYEVARRLREMPSMRQAVIAALSGWGQERDRQRSAEAGFDQHLVKPPTSGMIEQLVAALPRGASREGRGPVPPGP